MKLPWRHSAAACAATVASAEVGTSPAAVAAPARRSDARRAARCTAAPADGGAGGSSPVNATAAVMMPSQAGTCHANRRLIWPGAVTAIGA
jgi:hypothetical protein